MALDATTMRCSSSAWWSSAVVGYLTVTYFLRFLCIAPLDVFAAYRLGAGGS